MNKIMFLIKHVLIAYAICIIGITTLYITEALILDSHIGEAVGISLTYGVIMYAPMNIVFLLIIYFLNICKECLTNMWFTLIESILFMLSLQGVDNLFSLLRSKYILFKNNNDSILNSWCFDWQGGFILTCLFLLVLIFIIKVVLKICKNHEKHCSK